MSKSVEISVCGVVMPISAIDGCDEGHWSDVLEIITESVEAAGFVANLVSNADEVGIIHKRIIQNLYDNPVVVCDVSGKNPNVMFELGMRLAFDKPTIIIKDDKTPYSFDTSAIEHLEYPRDLRFSKVVDFKQKLAGKIVATHERAKNDQGYTTFLKHFGEFTVAKLEKTEVTSQEYILEELKNMRTAIQRFEQRPVYPMKRMRNPVSAEDSTIDICLGHADKVALKRAYETATDWPGVSNVEIVLRDSDHAHLRAAVPSGAAEIREELRRVIGRTSRPVRLNKVLARPPEQT
jgi:hypothetical protein